MKERAQLQADGFEAFVNNDHDDIDITQLDDEELHTMDKALINLNSAIASLGISGEEFLRINNEAFDSVRKSVGLSPLGFQRFREIYFACISGERAGFFQD